MLLSSRRTPAREVFAVPVWIGTGVWYSEHCAKSGDFIVLRRVRAEMPRAPTCSRAQVRRAAVPDRSSRLSIRALTRAAATATIQTEPADSWRRGCRDSPNRLRLTGRHAESPVDPLPDGPDWRCASVLGLSGESTLLSSALSAPWPLVPRGRTSPSCPSTHADDMRDRGTGGQHLRGRFRA